jgi:type IV pilus assembly protein PilM
LRIGLLKRFLTQRSTPLLGIDISSAAIRVIELARLPDGWRVEHYAEHELPRSVMREGSIVQLDQITQALSDAIQKSGSRLKEAAMALPPGLVIRKMLTLPNDLSEDEIELQVESEASQNLPFPLNELNLDFGVVGPSAVNPGNVDVILVATRKETIAERLEIAQAVGIRTVVIDIESQALMAALNLREEYVNPLVTPRAQAVLQIGRDSSYFFVENQRALIFEHELNIGFQRLQKDLDRHPDQVVATTEAFCSAVCQEFKRALQMYSTASQHVPIDKFFLSGQQQSLSRLPSMMKEQLSVIAEFANPFAEMKFSPAVNKSKLQAGASSWLVACGLAMTDKAS